MKQISALIIAAAFAVSAAVPAIAAEGKKAAAAPPAPAAAEAAKKDAVRKARPKVVTGLIDALDAAAGTFSVKGKRTTVTLKAGEKVKLDGYKVGDKVTVTYTEGVASKIVAAKKAAGSRGGATDAPKKGAAPVASPAGKK